MHLNVPVNKETKTKYWIRSIKWILLGVLIPELVILAAWRQFLSARRMGKELEHIFKARKVTNPSEHRRYEWTHVHSYYAGMGGFVFDTDFMSEEDASMIPSHKRLTLTATGVLLLAECGHLPDIEREFIWDKSKADGLAKALVCLQAGWFILQTVGRLIAHEPVTLLEVNTIAHIFCAFVCYGLWWHKPREVQEPIVLQGDWIAPICAYMYMSSRVSSHNISGLIVLSSWRKPQLAELAWYLDNSTGTAVKSTAAKSRTFIDESNDTKSSNGIELAEIRNHSDHVLTSAKGSFHVNKDSTYSTLDGTLKKRPIHTTTSLPKTVIKLTVTPSPLDTPEKCSRRIATCEQAIRRYPPIRALFNPPDEPTSPPEKTPIWLKPQVSHYVTNVATNWPSDYYLPGYPGELMGIAVWLATMLYGGVHMSAWYEYFPTEGERYVWRMASTYLASAGFFWVSANVIGRYWYAGGEWWVRFVGLRASKLEYVVLGTGATICGVSYILARFFLVIDAIVSLRQLPPTAYNTPDWTAIVPHL